MTDHGTRTDDPTTIAASVIVLPAVSNGQLAHDLRRLTELVVTTQKVDNPGGGLGGEYGYGAHFENDTFALHPYCWCERDDCPWCWGCVCPEGTVIYEVAGAQVAYEEWLAEYDRTGNTQRTRRQDPDLVCDYCRGERVSAPHFLHKPSGSTIHWYKYIGRSMTLDLRTPWADIVDECIASLELSSPGH